jgi:tetratricopeptide (TPR) repeat protein
MAFDAYSPCPCGSGKKFKWCCQPIHVEIDKAFRQDAEGQHESALRIMEEITKQHPTNPEAWGRKAQLLYQNGKVDEAEAALQKAFEVNPDYAFGHLLRGMFRQEEGEIAGALLLYRNAADLYDSEAKDLLAQVYALIAEAELKLNRPVAARTALRISLHLRPNEEVQQGLETIYGDKSRLPASARRDYTFLSPPDSAPAERRAAWSRALAGAATGKLTDAAKAFEQLTTEHPEDAAAWYNLGLVRAWLGSNATALEALDRYVNLETDEDRAAAAWALAEVLRFGQGMEDQADVVEHSVVYEIRDPQRFFDFLQEWQRQRRLTGVQVREEEGMISGVVLDQTGLLTAGTVISQPAKIGAYLLILGNLLVLRGTNREALERARRDVEEHAGPTLSAPRVQRGPAPFGEVLADALLIPLGASDQAEADRLVCDHIQRYFEETWIHRPLRALGGVAPIDAAGHGTLRKKLKGVVQFLQDCAAGPAAAYDFERLRRQLGLLQATPSNEAATSGTVPAIDAFGVAELAGLEPSALTDDQLEEAYRAAQKLDAHELASRFALASLGRPPRADQPDRYAYYNYLIQRALTDKNTDTALDYVNEGEKADCEQNEGRRRNDYELRRAQVLSKRGEAESARDAFERLIERVPGELRYRGTAAESMLSMKQGASALRFAEQGLAKAREKNDRDSEQYFMELVSAARKQVG